MLVNFRLWQEPRHFTVCSSSAYGKSNLIANTDMAYPSRPYLGLCKYSYHPAVNAAPFRRNIVIFADNDYS